MFTAVLITIILVLVLILYLTIRYFRKEINKLKTQHRHGLNRQSGAITGTILQKYLPFFNEYPYNPRDTIPIFDTFDYLVLRGRDNGAISEVIIQELKSGQSKLSTTQTTLRYCVEHGFVRFETWKWNEKSNSFHLVR